jgi:hypothetical protein
VIQLDSRNWQVILSAEHFVWIRKINADESLYCSDNAFDLWPGKGETVTAQVEKSGPYLELHINNMNQYINPMPPVGR